MTVRSRTLEFIPRYAACPTRDARRPAKRRRKRGEVLDRVVVGKGHPGIATTWLPMVTPAVSVTLASSDAARGRSGIPPGAAPSATTVAQPLGHPSARPGRYSGPPAPAPAQTTHFASG